MLVARQLGDGGEFFLSLALLPLGLLLLVLLGLVLVLLGLPIEAPLLVVLALLLTVLRQPPLVGTVLLGLFITLSLLGRFFLGRDHLFELGLGNTMLLGVVRQQEQQTGRRLLA